VGDGGMTVCIILGSNLDTEILWGMGYLFMVYITIYNIVVIIIVIIVIIRIVATQCSLETWFASGLLLLLLLLLFTAIEFSLGGSNPYTCNK
jgi:energy-coupling factor transporter transmembrane protein EcfT